MIQDKIRELVQYGLLTGLVSAEDEIYTTNRLLELFQIEDYPYGFGEKIEQTEEEAVNRQEERRITGNRQLVMEGTAIGSPVNGEIRKISQDTLQDTTEEAEDDNTKCITILPSDGRVYAPTAGKVLKLYPMGNRIRFRTDSGVELLLNICRDKEELHSAYYRCNVLPNEIVRKGKLLVEFDQEGLAREGVDTAVTMEMCQTPDQGRIIRTWKDYIRAGEELLWVDSVCLR